MDSMKPEKRDSGVDQGADHQKYKVQKVQKYKSIKICMGVQKKVQKFAKVQKVQNNLYFSTPNFKIEKKIIFF